MNTHSFSASLDGAVSREPVAAYKEYILSATGWQARGRFDPPNRRRKSGARMAWRSRAQRRLGQLFVGLGLYGVSMALLVRSSWGVLPWDVLHQGLARQVGWSLGLVTMSVGAALLLVWIPLGERPGVGTVSNVLVIGVVVDLTLAVLRTPSEWWLRAIFVLLGIGFNAVATAAYIGVDLGPGPRDGLMTGLVRRTGGSVRVVRTCIEVVIVAAGWLLGGTVGVGTVLYAVLIGPLVHWLLPLFWVAGDPGNRSTA